MRPNARSRRSAVGLHGDRYRRQHTVARACHARGVPSIGAPNPPTAPTPISVLPSNWIVDWRRFYDFAPPASPANVPINRGRKLDPFVVPQLHDLPGGGGSPPFRNLRCGVIFGLPCGQDVATAMEIEPLTPEEVATGPDGESCGSIACIFGRRSGITF
jgi:hypothetical protein